MNYTVISKSGWQGDGWAVGETFSDKGRAEAFARGLRQRRDATQDHYHVAIKAHRKRLADLLDRGGGDWVRFADGTCATVDW